MKNKMSDRSNVTAPAPGAENCGLISLVHGFEFVNCPVHFKTLRTKPFSGLKAGNGLNGVELKPAIRKKPNLRKALLPVLLGGLIIAPFLGNGASADPGESKKSEQKTKRDASPERTHELKGSGEEFYDFTHNRFFLLVSGVTAGFVVGWYVRIYITR